jgi:O-antigen/teichoic acid export membrane protein
VGLTSKLVSRFQAELLGRLVSTALGSILVIVLARLLEADEYGLLFLAISIFSLIGTLSKLGIGRSAGRYIAQYKETNPGQIPHILNKSFLMNILTIVLVCIITVAVSPIIPQIMDEPGLSPFFTLGLAFITFSTLETFVRRTLQGFEAIEITAGLRVFNHISKILFCAGLVLLGFGSVGAFFGYIVSYLLTTIVGLVILYTRYYSEYNSNLSMENGLSRRIAEYAIPITATDSAQIIDDRIDTILIGFFLNPVAVGYYVVGKQAISFMQAPVAALGFTLSPTLGAEKAKQNLSEAARIYENALIYSLHLYIPAAAGLFVLAEPTITFLFGEDYQGAITILQVFTLYAVLQCVVKNTSNGLDYLGRAKERAIVKTASSVLNLVLNILLIPTIGAIGAAYALVFSHSIYTIFNIYIINMELNLDFSKMLKSLSQTVVITVMMIIPVMILHGDIESLTELILISLIGTTVWVFMSLSVGFLNSDDLKKIVPY